MSSIDPKDLPPRERASVRGLIGIIILIVALIIYAILAVELALIILPDNLFIELIYYVVTGIIWIFPAMALLRWSAKRD